MLVHAVREIRAATDELQKAVQTADTSTLCIIFAATLAAFLPLDNSQLTFAIIGAVFYALLQKQDRHAPKKQHSPVIRNAGLPYNAQARSPKPKNHPSTCRGNLGTLRPTVVASAPWNASASVKKPNRGYCCTHRVCTCNKPVLQQSVQPFAAPSFCSTDWDGEVQELLGQIAPTAEAHMIVKQISQRMSQTFKVMIPEMEVAGFASGNLTCGKAFGVAVPDVDIVASVCPQILFKRLHPKSAHDSSAFENLDPRKLQKTALRVCTDQLVAAGFKFRRSAFKGLEPKVTLMVPASLGISTEPIPIDFSINVVTPLYNAALLTECGKFDTRAKELVLLVKRWAKDRAICHTPKGHLSPYMWGLLSIYFLQVRSDDEEGPLLPPLSHFEVSSSLLGRPAAAKWKPAGSAESKKTVGALFKEFVQFFHKEFDWQKDAVSIHAGQRVTASSLTLPSQVVIQNGSGISIVAPSIEDPFDVTRNLGDGMTDVSFARLKEELTRAQEVCMRSASLSELLEPWAPAAAEVDEQQ
jgi:hypothetical protein